MPSSPSASGPDRPSPGRSVDTGSLALLDFVIYPAALFPWLTFFSLYTLKQGDTGELCRVLRQRLGGYPAPVPRGSFTVWIHGVSVGETNCIPPFVNELNRRHPDASPVITTSTLTGQRVANDHFPDLPTRFFPLDYPGPVRRAFRHIRPDLILLVEQEIWPTFMREATRRHVPVAVVNGRMTEGSARAFGSLPDRYLDRMFRPLAAVHAQNEPYAERFRRLGVPRRRIRVTGNVKYDAMLSGTPDPPDLDNLRDRYVLSETEFIIAGGSVHPPEHTFLLDALEQLQERNVPSRLILAPRHLRNAGAMLEAARERGLSARLDGTLDDRPASPDDPPQVLVVDRMGGLMTVYGTADAVFVGGSLIDHGGQNMLEPAVLGKPVIVGPHTYNFTDEVDLLKKADGIREVPDGDTLVNTLLEAAGNPDPFRRLGRNAREAVHNHRGAAERSIRYLHESGLLET